MTKIRHNASQQNSKRLKVIQAEYCRRFKPTTISLAKLCDLAMELGIDKIRQRLNLDTPPISTQP